MAFSYSLVLCVTDVILNTSLPTVGLKFEAYIKIGSGTYTLTGRAFFFWVLVLIQEVKST